MDYRLWLVIGLVALLVGMVLGGWILRGKYGAQCIMTRVVAPVLIGGVLLWAALTILFGLVPLIVSIVTNWLG